MCALTLTFSLSHGEREREQKDKGTTSYHTPHYPDYNVTVSFPLIIKRLPVFAKKKLSYRENKYIFPLFYFVFIKIMYIFAQTTIKYNHHEKTISISPSADAHLRGTGDGWSVEI